MTQYGQTSKNISHITKHSDVYKLLGNAIVMYENAIMTLAKLDEIPECYRVVRQKIAKIASRLSRESKPYSDLTNCNFV